MTRYRGRILSYDFVPFGKLYGPNFLHHGQRTKETMLPISDIPILPITLGNEPKVRPYYEAVRSFCQERGVTRYLQTVARLRKRDPQLSDLIDNVGQPSAQWIDKQVLLMLQNDAEFLRESGSDREPLTEELARKTANEDHTKRLREYFAANPEAMRLLYFDFGAFPTTLEALKYGIGVIVACADYEAVERTHGAEIAELIKSGEQSQYWQGATAAEVAEWVNRFCEVWQ